MTLRSDYSATEPSGGRLPTKFHSVDAHDHAVAINSLETAKLDKAIVDAKGDIIAATAGDTPSRLAVGTNNYVLTADSTQATGLKWTPASAGLVFNVKDYGATGNGSTDDKAACQAAIDAAQAGGYYGGGIVYFPPGTYILGSTLLVKEGNVTLSGAGMRATRLVINSASATYSAITFTGYKNGVAATPTDASTFPSYFSVQDMLIEKGYPVVNETPGISIYCSLTSRIENVQINSFGTALLIRASRNLYADRVFTQAGGGDTVSNMYGWKFDTDYGDFSCYLSNCISSFGGTNTDPGAGNVPTSYAFFNDGQQGTDWFLTSCEANAATYGFYWNGSNSTLWCTGFDLHFVMCIADQCRYGFKFNDNLHVNAIGGQIDLDSCYWANRWTPVTPTPQGIGVWVNSSSGITIRGFQGWSGNPSATTQYQDNTGIYVEGNSRDVSISGCNLKGNFLQGIYLAAAKFATVFGNTILQTYSIAATGIRIGASTQSTITGNTIRSVTGLGTPMSIGISVDATSSGVAIGNNVVDTATVTTPLSISSGGIASVRNNIGIAPLIQAAYVATSQTTTSTTYTDLATTTDQVTVIVASSGIVRVTISAYVENNTSGIGSYVGFALSGANTVAAGTNNQQIEQWPNVGGTGLGFGNSFVLTGLTPGSTTFKMKYKVFSASTGTFSSRRISVEPL